jgi:hypothetical protein
MKKLFFSLIALALILFVSCKDTTLENKTEVEETNEGTEVIAAPDYNAFNNKVATLRSFLKAHGNEDLNTQKELLADTLKWSPPYYNGNQILGKEDYLTALQSYQDNFENINYIEGISLGDVQEEGWWSGSTFPEGTASSTPDAIRMYGTWTAIHTESKKEIGVKWYAIAWINEDGKIAQITEYFDAHGIAAQIAEE